MIESPHPHDGDGALPFPLQIEASPRRRLSQAIDDRSATVGVIGLGHLGLPLVRLFVAAGYRTLGFDIDEAKVRRLLDGKSYITGVSSQWVADAVDRKRFLPTADMRRLGEADVLLICVPAPLSDARDPEPSCVAAAAEAILRRLRVGQLVVVQTATYPGTTRDVVAATLCSGGMAPGTDFFVASSPQREDHGAAGRPSSVLSRVIGGLDSNSLELAVQLYRRLGAHVVPVSACEVAEGAQFLENAYWAVNVALANELKVLFHRMRIDVWEAIDAARTKPFGARTLEPGAGHVGHCLPTDPLFHSWVARKYGLGARFIELAADINASMPRYVFERVIEALNNVSKAVRGSSVCVLGVAQKKDAGDSRDSAGLRLMELLDAGGASLCYNDPHVPRLSRTPLFDVPELTSAPLTEDLLRRQDCVLIATDHSAYDYDFIVRHAPLVIDTHNATRAVRSGREKICFA